MSFRREARPCGHNGPRDAIRAGSAATRVDPRVPFGKVTSHDDASRKLDRFYMELNAVDPSAHHVLLTQHMPMEGF